MPTPLTPSQTAILVFGTLIWASFGLFHVLSTVEALGYQYLTPGGYATAYTSVMFGLTVITSLIAFFTMWGQKRTYVQLWQLGSEYRYVVWPVCINGFATVVLCVFYAWFVETDLGYSIIPSYSDPTVPFSHIDEWVTLNLVFAILNGITFLGGIRAIHTLYAIVGSRLRVRGTTGHAVFVSVEHNSPQTRIKTN